MNKADVKIISIMKKKIYVKLGCDKIKIVKEFRYLGDKRKQ